MDNVEKIKYRILIVDDEKNIQDMLSRHFRFLEYIVDTASNGQEALKIMAERKYDVVISDIKMPVMDGIQLLREIKQQYPMTYCIMITGYVNMENLLACMRHGADTCVFKPLEDIKELEEAVSSAISRLNRWLNKMNQLLRMKGAE